jgi:hypothetical protein
VFCEKEEILTPIQPKNTTSWFQSVEAKILKRYPHVRKSDLIDCEDDASLFHMAIVRQATMVGNVAFKCVTDMLDVSPSQFVFYLCERMAPQAKELGAEDIILRLQNLDAPAGKGTSCGCKRRDVW